MVSVALAPGLFQSKWGSSVSSKKKWRLKNNRHTSKNLKNRHSKLIKTLRTALELTIWIKGVFQKVLAKTFSGAMLTILDASKKSWNIFNSKLTNPLKIALELEITMESSLFFSKIFRVDFIKGPVYLFYRQRIT